MNIRLNNLKKQTVTIRFSFIFSALCLWSLSSYAVPLPCTESTPLCNAGADPVWIHYGPKQADPCNTEVYISRPPHSRTCVAGGNYRISIANTNGDFNLTLPTPLGTCIPIPSGTVIKTTVKEAPQIFLNFITADQGLTYTSYANKEFCGLAHNSQVCDFILTSTHGSKLNEFTLVASGERCDGTHMEGTVTCDDPLDPGALVSSFALESRAITFKNCIPGNVYTCDFQNLKSAGTSIPVVVKNPLSPIVCP